MGVTRLALVALASAVFCVSLVLPDSASARFEGKARSVHPNAIGGDRSRNWTYLGDTVRVWFRNTSLEFGQRQRYRSCYWRNYELSCRTRVLTGPGWDSWRLRILPPWAGYVRGRYLRFVPFQWQVAGRIVARHRAWVYE